MIVTALTRSELPGYAEDMAEKVTIEVGGDAGTQHRWSCLSCGTMGPKFTTVMRT